MKTQNFSILLFLLGIFINAQLVGNFYNEGLWEHKSLKLKNESFILKFYSFGCLDAYTYYELNGKYKAETNTLTLIPDQIIIYEDNEEYLVIPDPDNIKLDTIKYYLIEKHLKYSGVFDLYKNKNQITTNYSIFILKNNIFLIENNKTTFLELANLFNADRIPNNYLDIHIKTHLHNNDFSIFDEYQVFKSQIPKQYRNWFYDTPITVQINKLENETINNPFYKECPDNLKDVLYGCEKTLNIQKLKLVSDSSKKMFLGMNLYFSEDLENCTQFQVLRVNGKYGYAEIENKDCNFENNKISSLYNAD